MLYPVQNQKRLKMSLNGIWNFSIVDEYYEPKFVLDDFILMAVPSSYNDLVVDKKIANHVGLVCYEKTFQIPKWIHEEELRIRIGAATHQATVYINGVLIGSHQGGFLPIDLLIPKDILDDKNRLSIVLDNRLTYETLPIGQIDMKNGVEKQIIHYDFANLSGIHRDVIIYTRPVNPIEDIFITTKVDEDKAYVSYQIICDGEIKLVSVKDKNGLVVGFSSDQDGMITIHKPHLWDIGNGYLYTLEVSTITDCYEEKFGIREIEIKNDQLLLNKKKIYLKGFGMHEDHLIIGKGANSAHHLKDMNLLNWIHANSLRTSHYPYAEEIYDLADQLGILIINEIPAVGLNFWSDVKVFTPGRVDEKTKQVHMDQLTELVSRDKNHPSVIMYSLANEANTHEDGAYAYFKDIFAHMRTLTNLPLMIVEWVHAEINQVASLADVIGLNRYFAWYSEFGELEVIEDRIRKDFDSYYKKFKKPIILTEFGADTIAGLHALPSVPFSEEFQVEFLAQYVKSIQDLDYVIGEHVWNFADFMTKQGLTRFNGNKKGVFSRDRQPKMVAHFLKEHWKNK
ncbi:MAG: beta-glucuronidase [Firmicutes bacterium]|nr:beta-glucuronidase [Bacillota bacterium]